VIGVLPHLALARVRPPPVLPPRLQDPRIRARLSRIIWRVIRGLYRMREEAESIMCEGICSAAQSWLIIPSELSSNRIPLATCSRCCARNSASSAAAFFW
jgi:hypothetical protein